MRDFKINFRIFTILFALLLVGLMSILMRFNDKPAVLINQNDKLEVQDGTEVTDDNWELSVVFYDSTVDNGTTPLTEINWHCDDENEQRQIKVQINYKNTNSQNTYNPNDIAIEMQIPGGRNIDGHGGNHSYGIPPDVVSAGSLEDGYEWRGNDNYSRVNPRYTFYNNVTIEKNSNFEGSIQMVFNIPPVYYFGNLYNDPVQDSIYATHLKNGFTERLKATLKYKGKSVTSNELQLTFTSEKAEYPITLTPKKINSLDGLPNANDYIWVKWSYETKRETPKPRRAHFLYSYSDLPADVVVYDSELNQLEVVDNKLLLNDVGEYWLNRPSPTSHPTELFIGYPKALYENQEISNNASLYGTYEDENEPSLLSEDSKTINLADYEFHYTGNLYSITKDYRPSTSTAALNSGVKEFSAVLNPRTIYTGTKYDVTISDDFMLFPMADGSYQVLDDTQYNIKRLEFNGSLRNNNGVYIKNKNMEIYVRYANSTEYVKYPDEIELGDTYIVYKFSEDNIVGIQLVIKDLECGIGGGRVGIFYQMHTSGIADSGSAYNFAYLQIKQNGEAVNTPTLESYGKLSGHQLFDVAQYDLDHYGMYMQRTVGNIQLVPNYLTYSIEEAIDPSQSDIPNERLYRFNGRIASTVNFSNGYSNNFHGQELIDYLPEGLDVYNTEEELLDLIGRQFKSSFKNSNFKLQSGTVYNGAEEFWPYYAEHLNVSITKNYNDTNRTMLKIKQDFSDNPLVVSVNRSEYSFPDLYVNIKFYVSYDNYLEFGSTYVNELNGFLTIPSNADFDLSTENYSGRLHWYTDSNDLNENGINSEKYMNTSNTINVISAIETHQDVQTSVQSSVSNFATGKVNTLKDDEYTYKLRVRTGQNDVTNLVIYDSIEDYAKNPNLEIVKASAGKPSWQGELLDIDTSFAESKGYQVKVYYNENPNPGKLGEDSTWQEYTDSTDKSLVKAVAFKYLDAEGNPAVLPANTNTHVLLKMKSPNADYKTFSYNGCWTEWNAIDSTTGRPVDFITGINSNIVKVALPTSVEPENVNITLNKVWDDKYNSLNLRPSSVTFKIIPNDDYTKATEVPLSGSGNTWSTEIAVPNYDDYGEVINYTIREDTIELANGYKYIPSVNNYIITNTLSKELTLTKIWKDNTNAYLTRPSSVTFKVKQNGNDFKTVTFGGNLTSNTWTETITVPVYSSNGSEYNYTIEEVTVDNYTSSCTNLTCTNTLTGNENITVKKVWEDKNNSYNTRPNQVTIRLKQNGNAYQSVNLTGTTNTWTSDAITVPKYDSNGVKYTYTIEETQLEDYGQVTYDQANLKVTNTLKKNIAIIITKKWIDNSNALNLRPNNLTITILQNGNNYQNVTLSGTTDTWTTTIEVPKYDSNQNEYTYTIKELTDGVSEDYSNVTYSQEELSITNKLEKKTNITISKVWDDGDNRLLTRPESITVNLLRNGEQYEELEIIPDNIQDNTWSITVEDLDVYDNRGAKYTYTIEENLLDELERYETITYDQTTFTITNKLTVPPKVTLYFTVKNGYTLPGSDDILYDQEGYNDVLSRYDLNGEDEYIFHFKLENVETGEIIEGKLSTQGTLEFDDVPYGTYRAREGEDKYFDFVSMIEIEEVLGVTFKRDEMGGTITISPTGKDIVYGAQITNKIEIPVNNPETKSSSFLIPLLIVAVIAIITSYYSVKKLKFLS